MLIIQFYKAAGFFGTMREAMKANSPRTIPEAAPNNGPMMSIAKRGWPGNKGCSSDIFATDG